MKAKKIRDRGIVTNRHEADILLERPGDVVLVFRGVARSFVMACPDGCGEKITINLDPRTTKAWRFFKKRNQISLFPSVWRDTGCGSHFIIWNHHIVWCGFGSDESEVNVEDAAELRRKVVQVLTESWMHYTEIAQLLDEVPWDVDWACRYLSTRQIGVEEGGGKLKGYFRNHAKRIA